MTTLFVKNVVGRSHVPSSRAGGDVTDQDDQTEIVKEIVLVSNNVQHQDRADHLNHLAWFEMTALKSEGSRHN